MTPEHKQPHQIIAVKYLPAVAEYFSLPSAHSAQIDESTLSSPLNTDEMPAGISSSSHNSECDFPDNSQSSTPELSARYTGVAWTEGETKLMLSLYREHFDQIGPLKKLKIRKELWKMIKRTMKSQLGSNFTETQIENRYKTISRRHKQIISNNRTSGASRITLAYEEEFKEIASIDDSLEPDVRMDTTSIQLKNYSPSMDQDQQPGTSAVTPTSNKGPQHRREPKSGPSGVISKSTDIQIQMLETFKKSQEDKNRRHEERMKKIDVITALPTKIAEKP